MVKKKHGTVSFPPRPSTHINQLNQTKVNYEEGSGSNLYSSMEWALTEVDNIPTYLGKWGHTLVAWTTTNDEGIQEPALYLIAGDAVGGGSFVSDAFVSTETCTSCVCIPVAFGSNV